MNNADHQGVSQIPFVRIQLIIFNNIFFLAGLQECENNRNYGQ